VPPSLTISFSPCSSLLFGLYTKYGIDPSCLPDSRLLAISFNRWSCRTYIFVLHESVYASYCNTLNRFLETAWGTVKVGGKPAFIQEPI